MMTLATHRLDDGAHCVVCLQLPVHFDELKLVPPPDPTVTHGTDTTPSSAHAFLQETRGRSAGTFFFGR
jgi:hypothetical protein